MEREVPAFLAGYNPAWTPRVGYRPIAARRGHAVAEEARYSRTRMKAGEVYHGWTTVEYDGGTGRWKSRHADGRTAFLSARELRTGRETRKKRGRPKGS